MYNHSIFTCDNATFVKTKLTAVALVAVAAVALTGISRGKPVIPHRTVTSPILINNKANESGKALPRQPNGQSPQYKVPKLQPYDALKQRLKEPPRPAVPEWGYRITGLRSALLLKAET